MHDPEEFDVALKSEENSKMVNNPNELSASCGYFLSTVLRYCSIVALARGGVTRRSQMSKVRVEDFILDREIVFLPNKLDFSKQNEICVSFTKIFSGKAPILF